MDLFTIHNDLIANRTAEAWYRVMISGPNFHYRWDYGLKGGEPYSHVIDEHRSCAVLREDPRLTVAWGMDIDPDEKRSNYDWASIFPNKSVRGVWVDFFWCGSLIDRVELAVVDGGHGLVPFPRTRGEVRSVSAFEVAVADLIAQLDGGRDSVDYISMLEFRVEPDENRHSAASQ